MIDTANPAMVIDIGSHSIKAGLANPEEDPKIIPSFLGRVKGV